MSYIPVTVRRAVLRRDRATCRYCGVTGQELVEQFNRPGGSGAHRRYYQLHFDHLIPKTFGGPETEWNIAVACCYCNLSRQHRHFDADQIGRHLLRDMP